MRRPNVSHFPPMSRISINSHSVGLVDMEKTDIFREFEEHNSAEITKLRGEWDGLAQNVHHLEAEVDASQTLVREVCAEREELRKMLETKQNEISAEDQEVMTEMQMLLGEFETHNTESGEAAQKSSFELLKQCAGVLEKNVERLAQRAEVGLAQEQWIVSALIPYPDKYANSVLGIVYPTAKRADQVLAGTHEELRRESG